MSLGKCPRCKVEVERDLPGRCNDAKCPPLASYATGSAGNLPIKSESSASPTPAREEAA